MMTAEEQHELVRATTDPNQAAGWIEHNQTSTEDTEWILETFGDNHLVWMGLISRNDATEEMLVRASHVPHAAVLGRLVLHRKSTPEMVIWIRDYATELAGNGNEETRLGFEHVAEFAGKVAERSK